MEVKIRITDDAGNVRRNKFNSIEQAIMYLKREKEPKNEYKTKEEGAEQMIKSAIQEVCIHNWRATFTSSGYITYWYCTKCRWIEDRKVQEK